MSAIDQTITIPAITPANPIVLADANFTHTLARVALEIAHLKVIDDVSAQSAANYLQRLTKAAAGLENARKTVKAPFLRKCEEIDAAAAKPAADIESMKASLKKMLASYEALQRAKAQEAEAARQKEIARLQALRDEEVRRENERKAALALEAAAAAKRAEFRAQAEAATKVLVNGHILSISTDGKRMFWVDLATTPNATEWAEATPEIRQQIEEALPNYRHDPPSAAEPPSSELDFGFDEPPEPPPKTDVQKQLEAVVHAPAVLEAKPAGVRFQSRLRIKSINVAELPELFLNISANEAKIRSTFVVGWRPEDPIPTCAGVEFEIERTVASSGKDVF